MRQMRWLLALAAMLVLSACAQGPRFLSYDGPEVTQVHISKSSRRMHLIHDRSVLKSYDVALGFAPEGPKRSSGDGRTPEGVYWVDRRNPKSAYHLSLGISYPNAADRAASAAEGLEPGTDIFIHGRGPDAGAGRDWTAGCIAVEDDEIEEVYAMVRDGTPVVITP